MVKSISWILLFLSALLAFISVVILIEKLFFTNCTNSYSELILEYDEIYTEVGRGKLVKGYLSNKGIEDEFRLSVDGIKWGVIKPEKMRLNENETEEIFVYISPIKSGKFDAKIKAESYCQKHQESIVIHVT
ncbi:MAG: hypothetical protein N3E38_00110 [Candidatus Aenigmarchaeota archaeon]|nr:hypothetical protein [Candidatus Aenigmarchaeota archaeon]